MKYINKHNRFWLNIGILFLLVVMISSCKSTKLVPEDEYLLNRVEISSDNSKLDEDELKPSLKQQPNQKTLGLFRFHLAAYNLFHPKDSSKDFPKWFTRIGEVIGEPPSIYQPSLHYKSKKNLQNYLEQRGYYEATIEDSLIVNENHPQKARLIFDIKTGPAYRINNLTYDISDPFVKDIILSDTSNSLVKEGMIFDSEKLLKERDRIVQVMKNKGYYYFSDENIHYYADTTENKYKVDIRLTIKKSFDADRYFLEEIFTPQEIKKVYFYINFDRGAYAVDKKKYLNSLDTVQYLGFTFLVDGEMKINKDVILQANYIKPGQTYNRENVVSTQKHLSSLGQFKLINIQFQENTDQRKDVWNAENPYLDAHIFLSPSLRQSYSITTEGTNSSGNYGLAGVVTYQNRNLLGGAEQFSTNLRGSMQTLVGSEGQDRFMNTFEFGADFKLDVPKLMIPLQSERFVKEHDPRTNFVLSFNHQNRPDYTRTLGNASFGYTWFSKNDFYRHSINPIEYYTVKIFDFDEGFRQQIDSLYIRYSFQDQLITAFSYDLLYNNQNYRKNTDYWYIWMNLETSGNLFRSLGQSLELPQNEADAYSIFNLEFAQYVKADFDIRYNHIIDRSRSLVSRVYLGAGLPYGNSTQGLPFVKKYYIGGANSIRAWQVRTLGPGSYDEGSLYNQIADMKLLFNLEYRFDIISFLEGAIFMDAGNIWAIDPSDDREGALFKTDRFYKEIALGTGIGFRMDFSFFILRFDFGMPLYDPGYPEDDRWLAEFDELEFSDFTLNFGIGYPF
ncbi:MAG: BamA/TamA family outer membrane protein [Bacteroidota bacterium]